MESNLWIFIINDPFNGTDLTNARLFKDACIFIGAFPALYNVYSHIIGTVRFRCVTSVVQWCTNTHIQKFTQELYCVAKAPMKMHTPLKRHAFVKRATIQQIDNPTNCTLLGGSKLKKEYNMLWFCRSVFAYLKSQIK